MFFFEIARNIQRVGQVKHLIHQILIYIFRRSPGEIKYYWILVIRPYSLAEKNTLQIIDYGSCRLHELHDRPRICISFLATRNMLKSKEFREDFLDFLRSQVY